MSATIRREEWDACEKCPSHIAQGSPRRTRRRSKRHGGTLATFANFYDDFVLSVSADDAYPPATDRRERGLALGCSVEVAAATSRPRYCWYRRARPQQLDMDPFAAAQSLGFEFDEETRIVVRCAQSSPLVPAGAPAIQSGLARLPPKRSSRASPPDNSIALAELTAHGVGDFCSCMAEAGLQVAMTLAVSSSAIPCGRRGVMASTCPITTGGPCGSAGSPRSYVMSATIRREK